MNVRFKERSLERLEAEVDFYGGYSEPVTKAFRRRMQQIRAAEDERTFYALRSLRFEKLKGSRDQQYSMRLNDQWRLIVEFEAHGPQKTIIIIGIEDYHR
ncbi:MAG: plasmid maintenance system killer protein [Acidobacteria bacterium]|nr:MAG: plasmid maintenance system killer protein [Acidobacteriota bacterium]